MRLQDCEQGLRSSGWSRIIWQNKTKALSMAYDKGDLNSFSYNI